MMQAFAENVYQMRLAHNWSLHVRNNRVLSASAYPPTALTNPIIQSRTA